MQENSVQHILQHSENRRKKNTIPLEKYQYIYANDGEEIANARKYI